MEGQTENFTSRDNFTPGGQLRPWGSKFAFAKLAPSPCLKKTVNGWLGVHSPAGSRTQEIFFRYIHMCGKLTLTLTPPPPSPSCVRGFTHSHVLEKHKKKHKHRNFLHPPPSQGVHQCDQTFRPKKSPYKVQISPSLCTIVYNDFLPNFLLYDKIWIFLQSLSKLRSYEGNFLAILAAKTIAPSAKNWAQRQKITPKNYAQCQKIALNLGSMLGSQFSAIFAIFRRKKLAFFSKTNVTIKFFQKIRVVWAKTPIFSLNFSAKIFSKS
jgi:hypothetical protein